MYDNLETVYIEGTPADFVVFIQSQGDKAQLVVVKEKFRWVVEREDGTKYIARPKNG